MSEITVLRASADPSAPNGLNRSLAAALGVGSQLLALTTLPLWTLKWVLFRPKQSLKVYIAARIFRLSLWMAPFLSANETCAEAAAIPKKPLIPMGKDLEGAVSITTVTAPLAPALQDAILKPPGVEAKPAPGFIITPKGAKGAAKEKAKDGEKIILFYHGGAYVVGHPLWTPFGAKIARDTQTRVYAAQYRKAVSATSAWPAPLLDGLAAWAYITTDLAFDPSNILIMGDSAGAHLSLNVTAALARAGVPGPGGLALASPWVDYTQSTRSWRANTDDYLSSRWIRWSIASITRWYTPDAVQGPVFSPARAPAGAHKHLQDKPVFVSVGTEETLLDEVRALVRNLRGDGVKVTVYDDEGGLHDAPTFTPLFGTEESYKAFADGVNAVLEQIGK